jgi:uncharacterized protein YyaL (SSP411 family)
MNRLAAQTSPYLRQHQDNPVDWYPWGEEAFALARELDRPLFVSIGYSACHWCHVMAHESFEDDELARYLNEHFVSVKVDREERPDVDAIYLEAVQAITGSGGWPLSVFVNHDGAPFFGGTYFPPTPRHGLPSFRQILEAVSRAWAEKRSDLAAQSNIVLEALNERLTPAHGSLDLTAAETDALFGRAIDRFAELYDPEHGGIGEAPKFAQPPMLELLAEAAGRGDEKSLEMLANTLDAMAAGGIYDHLGGGFARYSVDRFWLVPHFEKMLYDQASLARVYLHAYLLTGTSRWRQVVEETLEYVLRDLSQPGGGIAAAEDADSEGHEGLFYVWTPEEFLEVLGEGAQRAMDYYGVVPGGNFEGRSILHRPVKGALERSPEIEAARAALFERRAQRVRPGLDEKIVTEWNAMIAGTLAEAGAALGNTRFVDAAVEVATFLLEHLRDGSGRWLRSYAAGHADNLATAGDYAWLIDAFTRIGEATGQAIWTTRALEAAEGLMGLFSADNGAFYLTGSDSPALVVRPQDRHDGVVPAVGSIATSALYRLGALTGDQRVRQRAEESLAARAELITEGPLAVAHLCGAARAMSRGSIEIVISGDRPDLVRASARTYLPHAVLAWGEPWPSPLWQGREGEGAYVCTNGVCLLPIGDVEDLVRALETNRLNP